MDPNAFGVIRFSVSSALRACCFYESDDLQSFIAAGISVVIRSALFLYTELVTFYLVLNLNIAPGSMFLSMSYIRFSQKNIVLMKFVYASLHGLCSDLGKGIHGRFCMRYILQCGVLGLLLMGIFGADWTSC